MGFTVTETISITRFGINQPNCYVTLRGSFVQNKQGVGNFGGMIPMPMQPQSTGNYTLQGRYYIYATKDAPEPLLQDWITLPCTVVPTTPIQDLYTHLKSSLFPGKTITDDL